MDRALGARGHCGHVEYWQLWWESTHTVLLEARALEKIVWDEFREVLYSKYFSAIVKAKKKMKFLSLRQVGVHPWQSTKQDSSSWRGLPWVASQQRGIKLPSLFQAFVSVCKLLFPHFHVLP